MNMFDGALELDDTVRDLSSEVLDERGRMRILPAAYWAATTVEERALFGNRNAVYSFPTVELVEHLRTLIDGRRAIEIGAGHGVLADALGIPATDNYMQAMPEYRTFYMLSGQPPITYGPNVENMDAAEAIAFYRPQVVIACWVTHKYNARRHWAGGNEIGVDEAAIIRRADYVFVGNEKVHKDKAIWEIPHHIEHPAFVYSRAHNGTPEFIATWRRRKA